MENLKEIIEIGIPEYYTQLVVLKKINGNYNDLIEKIKSKMNLDLNEDESIILGFNSNNYKILTTVSILDLMVVSKGIITSQSLWEKIFYIKNANLIIHETINSCYKINNIFRDYKELLQEDLKQITNQLKSFSKNEEISKIRNKIAGHIDLEDNFSVYFNIIESFDTDLTLKLISEFIRCLNSIKLTVDEILNKIKTKIAKKEKESSANYEKMINQLENNLFQIDNESLSFEFKKFIDIAKKFKNLK